MGFLYREDCNLLVIHRAVNGGPFVTSGHVMGRGIIAVNIDGAYCYSGFLSCIPV